MKSQKTMKKAFMLLFIFFLIAFNAIALENEEKVMGIGILTEIAGMWNGPVFSDTPAGSFDTWYVDFRPVSASQVSQYSTLDADTLNYMSFFIVKHDDQLKVALRTEGGFSEQSVHIRSSFSKTKNYSWRCIPTSSTGFLHWSFTQDGLQGEEEFVPHRLLLPGCNFISPQW